MSLQDNLTSAICPPTVSDPSLAYVESGATVARSVGHTIRFAAFRAMLYMDLDTWSIPLLFSSCLFLINYQIIMRVRLTCLQNVSPQVETDYITFDALDELIN